MLVKLRQDDRGSSAWGFRDEQEPRLLEQARAIRPILERNAPLGEQKRTLTDEVVAALDGIEGIWSMAVPERLGGLGVSATTVARVGAELAKGDPSVAWVVQIINGTTWVGTLTSDALQEVLFKDGVPRIAGAFNPPGVAVPTDGGYLVSGKWPYSSGFRQASWGQWGVSIKKPDGTMVPGNFVYIPTDQLTLEDTWMVTGMQGTGSDTAIAKDIFVPEPLVVHAARPYGHVEPGKTHHGAPSDFFHQIAFVHRSGAGQLVGILEAMLERVSDAAHKKGVVSTTYAKQIDSHVVQRDIGETAIKIHTARLLVEQSTREIDAAALKREVPDVLFRARNKAMTGMAVKLMAESADKLMFIAGSGAFSHSNPIQRYWRDFAMAARHIANLPDVAFEVLGRAHLGVEPNICPPQFI